MTHVGNASNAKLERESLARAADVACGALESKMRNALRCALCCCAAVQLQRCVT